MSSGSDAMPGGLWGLRPSSLGGLGDRQNFLEFALIKGQYLDMFLEHFFFSNK